MVAVPRRSDRGPRPRAPLSPAGRDERVRRSCSRRLVIASFATSTGWRTHLAATDARRGDSEGVPERAPVAMPGILLRSRGTSASSSLDLFPVRPGLRRTDTAQPRSMREDGVVCEPAVHICGVCEREPLADECSLEFLDDASGTGFECRWLPSQTRIFRDSVAHRTADSGEAEVDGPRQRARQRGASAWIVAKEQQGRSTGKRPQRPDRGAQLVGADGTSTKSNTPAPASGITVAEVDWIVALFMS